VRPRTDYGVWSISLPKDLISKSGQEKVYSTGSIDNCESTIHLYLAAFYNVIEKMAKYKPIVLSLAKILALMQCDIIFDDRGSYYKCTGWYNTSTIKAGFLGQILIYTGFAFTCI